MKIRNLVVVGISMLMLAPVGVATAATKPTINPKQVLTCPTPVIPQPLTGGNGTTSLITTVGTSLSSSSYKTLAGVGNYSYAMNPTTANAGAITFDTNTAVIKISTGATAGTYLETVTALALDTATVTQNFLVTIKVNAAPVVDTRTVMVLDTRTVQLCANLGHETTENNEGHETSKGKKVEVTKENNAEFNRPVPKNSEGGHQKVVQALAPVAKKR